MARTDEDAPRRQPAFDEMPELTPGRRDADFYRTPVWMTLALLEALPSLRGLRVLEPCVGDGAISAVLEATYGDDIDLVTNDRVVRPPHVPDFTLDATRLESWRAFPPCAAAITNPPFDQALPIADLALAQAPLVALVLPLSWLEPTKERGPWLQAHPPQRLIAMPRHDFRGTGGRAVGSVAWFVWSSAPWQPVGVPAFTTVTAADRDRLSAAWSPGA